MSAFTKWKELKEAYNIKKDDIIFVMINKDSYNIIVKQENLYLDIELQKKNPSKSKIFISGK